MNTQTKNAPVTTHRDGAISAKVWRNLNNEGQPFYTTSFQRTYTNTQGHPAETHSFSRNDLLKVKQLADEAYRSIAVNREMDKEQTQQVEQAEHPQQTEQQQVEHPQQVEQPQQDLAQQRDAAMDNAAPTQNQGNPHEPVPERG